MGAVRSASSRVSPVSASRRCREAPVRDGLDALWRVECVEVAVDHDDRLGREGPPAVTDKPDQIRRVLSASSTFTHSVGIVPCRPIGCTNGLRSEPITV